MSENEAVKFADQSSARFGNGERFIGKETTVNTIAYMAAVHALASYDANGMFKPGDQIEWTVTLSGRTTVEPRMIEDATEQLLK
jgi:hypothetical protein